jgi:copper chaperone
MMARSRVQALIPNKALTMTIELTLPDMTCGHCVKTVTATAQRLDPQAQVRTDLATHRAVFETSVARDVLAKALADEGYPAAPR